jgi:hypothetical protein
MMVAPNIGWSNAIPDSAGDVDLSVNGEKFNFQGSAYHDHVSFLNSYIHTLTNPRPRIGELSLSKTTLYSSTGEEVVLATTQSYGLLSPPLTAWTMQPYMSQHTRRFL